MIDLYTQAEKVSLYRNGAEVIRGGDVHLSVGTHELRIFGLTSLDSADSVRILADGLLQSSSARFVFPEESEQVSALKDEIELVRKGIETRNLQIQLWQENGDFRGHSGADAQMIEKYISGLPERIGTLQKEILQEERKIKQLEKELAEVQKKEEKPVIILEISALEERTYHLELKYFETRAFWRPFYEIHSDGKAGLEVKMRARMIQCTAEDWKDVGISLLSGDPVHSGSLPVMEPSYLEICETSVRLHPPMAFMGMNAKMMAVEEEAVEDTVELMNVVSEEADVKTDEVMTEYILPGLWNIAADEEGTLADLTKTELPAVCYFAAVPKTDPHVYLTAEVDPALLPANTGFEAEVYLKGRYTGKVYVNPVTENETVRITLGQEDKIQVIYEEVSRKSSRTLLKAQNVREHLYKTTVRNHSGAEAEVTVFDQIPLSENRDISVEPTDIKAYSLDESNGFLTKTISLADGESEVFSLGYKITWPKDQFLETTHGKRQKFCPSCGSAVSGKFCPVCGSRVE